jgi:hypothetical protein
MTVIVSTSVMADGRHWNCMYQATGGGINGGEN